MTLPAVVTTPHTDYVIEPLIIIAEYAYEATLFSLIRHY